ncbi:MAG: type II secretion system minor pseudopilin GspK [Candidatus Hydrogenedentes bacterium]|nr:type II secretion system minor pseudopilin GspK [Candidatus Hydrogenedentota bacterium]
MNTRLTAKRNMRRDDEGIALVLALLFVVLLTVIIVEFAYEMQVDATLIERHTSTTEAYMAAKSSIALSMSILAADLLFGEEEAELESTDVYDSLDEPWASSTPLLNLNEAMISVQIDDEYAKINLNALIYEDRGGGEIEFVPLVDALTVLFQVRMREGEVLPIDVILDWLDTDDETRPEGAENDYYQQLEVPFECKNGPMDSIEELLLLPGITLEVYFGDDEAEFEQLPLNELLTVHGHPEGRVNVNTASFEVLEAMLTADGRDPAPSQKADEILQRLDEVGPYRSIGELRSEAIIRELPPPRPRDEDDDKNQLPPQLPPPDLFDVASEVFRIQGDGQSDDAQVRVEAFVWRDTHGSGAAQMFRIIDWRVIQ